MTTYVPTSRIETALPGAEVLAPWATVPGEEQLFDLPCLFSWLVAAAPDASGIYADRSPRGHTWVQADAAKRPAVTASWLSTGRPAFTFDGTTVQNIAANFSAPVGEISAAFVCSLDASTSTGDNKYRTLLTSTSATINQHHFAQVNRVPRLTTTGRLYSKISAAALSTAAPHLLLMSWSGAGRKLSLSVDGGTWQGLDLTTTTNRGTLVDCTAMIGGGDASTASQWLGSIAEVLLFSTSLEADATAAALVTAVLKAKYGIA